MGEIKWPKKKATHEDGTGHNCDVKGCPMCWNDGYNQGRDESIKAYESAQPTRQVSEECKCERCGKELGGYCDDCQTFMDS